VYSIYFRNTFCPHLRGVTIAFVATANAKLVAGKLKCIFLGLIACVRLVIYINTHNIRYLSEIDCTF
jgi:hypothetical protein